MTQFIQTNLQQDVYRFSGGRGGGFIRVNNSSSAKVGAFTHTEHAKAKTSSTKPTFIGAPPTEPMMFIFPHPHLHPGLHTNTNKNPARPMETPHEPGRQRRRLQSLFQLFQQ